MNEAETEEFYIVKYAAHKYGTVRLLLSDTKELARLSPFGRRPTRVKVSSEFARWIRKNAIALMYVEKLPDYSSRITQIGNAFDLDRSDSRHWTPRRFRQEARRLKGLVELMEGKNHAGEDQD